MELSNSRRIPFGIGAFLGGVGLLSLGCEHREPPTWDAGAGSLSAAPLPPPPPAPVEASAFAGLGTVDAAAVDPATLPQTRDRPRSSGGAYDARVRALWDAIVADDPGLATPAFFPVGAYLQVKAIAAPESDWKHRLLAAFARDIHRLHEHLMGTRRSPDAAPPTLLELEVPLERARWVEPGEESNKIGYWRVFGSKLRFQAGDTVASFDVSSLISWRGEWYVVHLSGFK
jgi:hypothetical protein